jgi:hypothetical protein
VTNRRRAGAGAGQQKTSQTGKAEGEARFATWMSLLGIVLGVALGALPTIIVARDQITANDRQALTGFLRERQQPVYSRFLVDARALEELFDGAAQLIYPPPPGRPGGAFIVIGENGHVWGANGDPKAELSSIMSAVNLQRLAGLDSQLVEAKAALERAWADVRLIGSEAASRAAGVYVSEIGRMVLATAGSDVAVGARSPTDYGKRQDPGYRGAKLATYLSQSLGIFLTSARADLGFALQ